MKRNNCWVISLILLMGVFITGGAFAQSETRTVKGNVKDTGGIPVFGATVMVKGTTTGDMTDANGNFELKAAPEAILTISFIGYKTIEYPLQGKANVNIILQEDTELLDEVVVIGYGTVRKEDLTGSVASITAKDFNEGIASSPLELVTGKIAGVQIDLQIDGSPNFVHIYANALYVIQGSTNQYIHLTIYLVTH